MALFCLQGPSYPVLPKDVEGVVQVAGVVVQPDAQEEHKEVQDELHQHQSSVLLPYLLVHGQTLAVEYLSELAE